MIDNFEDESNDNLIETTPASAADAGARLDKFLAVGCDGFSRSRLAALIRGGNVFKNGSPVTDTDYKICAGDVFELSVPAPVAAIPEPQNIPLDVVYEDADLLVVNKTAGMVVHPAAGNHDGTLVNALLAHCGDSLSGIGGVIRPGIVHRLDKETSGLLVVAKNDAAHRFLSEQFAVHSLERSYLALVWNRFNALSGVVETQIGRSPFDRKKMAVVKNGGKRAETHFRVLKMYAGGLVNLVECTLKTGRTHQVRVHMTDLGHPLIGDKVYGKAPKEAQKSNSLTDAVAFSRQALHSYKMSFIHPKTRKEIRFEIPLAPDMLALTEKLSEI